MCIAIPARIVSIDESTAEVDVNGNRVPVNVSLISPKVGDFVLVHAGYAVDIIQQSAAEELAALLDELDENNEA